MILQVKLINVNKILKDKLDKIVKVFVIHFWSLIAKIIIYLVRKAGISLLLVEKNTILAKQFDFVAISVDKVNKSIFLTY